MWSYLILDEAARSAMVRATFKIRWYPLADSFPESTYCFKSAWDFTSVWQYFLIWGICISEFTNMPSLANRSFWTWRAFSIFILIAAEEFSPLDWPANFSYFTAGTSIKISILSIRGPESFLLYIDTCEGEQVHGFSGLLRYPQGQGFEAAMSMKRLGNINVFLAREMVIFPSSMGWRKDSKTSRWNSGNSSKNSTPRWARVISPGFMGFPPPMTATSDTTWWGERNGLTLIMFWSSGNSPATL